jgi:hypothetical protein
MIKEKNSNWPKIFYYVSIFVLLGWLGFLGQIAWWMYYPVNVVDFFNEPCPILNPDGKVKRGEYLEFSVEYKKFINYPAQVSRSLVNDRVVTLTCETGSLKPNNGKHKTNIRVFIPLNVFPGKYKLITTMTYQVNPLRHIIESYETDWFEVIE